VADIVRNEAVPYEVCELGYNILRQRYITRTSPCFLWILQNNLNFFTSSDTVYSAEPGHSCEIEKVYVGTIGDYAPLANVNLV
jgi:hypothetical protein